MTGKTLLVGGTFGLFKGDASGIAGIIGKAVKADVIVKGGTYGDLEEAVESVGQYGVIYWFPDVPNELPKLVGQIKEKAPHSILVTSKRNDEDKYSIMDIVHHALGTKSNLVLEFSRAEEEWGSGRWCGRVLDPLGNCYLDYCGDFLQVGKVLAERVEELKNFSRVPSKSIGPEILAPDEPEFLELVRGYANDFHDIIHPVKTNRFLGNASFRCEAGFPSFRQDGLVYVSKRDIDKRELTREGFVAVEPGQLSVVNYYGDAKPSVDTPIHLQLYNYYPAVRYMLHSHTYVLRKPFTEKPIPCGAVEEWLAVKSVMENRDSTDFAVNLRGHGSIVLASNIKYLEKIPFMERPVPEMQMGYG